MGRKQHKYYVHFHNGSMNGDCSEASIAVSDLGITFKQALAQLFTIKGMRHNWSVSGSDVEELEEELQDFIECNNDLVGAWIVDGETEKKFNQAVNYMEEPGGDSEAYAQQAAWKGLYKAFAIKTIGKAAK